MLEAGSPVIILSECKVGKRKVLKGMRGRLISKPGPNFGIVSLVIFGDPSTAICQSEILQIPRDCFGPYDNSDGFFTDSVKVGY